MEFANSEQWEQKYYLQLSDGDIFRKSFFGHERGNGTGNEDIDCSLSYDLIALHFLF